MADLSVLESIAFDAGILAVSTMASFLIPGIGGVIVSGIIQIVGQTLGLEIMGQNLPTDPVWWITNVLSVFGPYFKEITTAKLDLAILKSAEKGVQSVNKVLERLDNMSRDAIEYLKTTAGEKVLASGLTKVVFLDEKGKLQKQKDYSGGAA